MTVVLDSRRDFTLENFRRVAVDGESVRFSAKAKKAMNDAHKSFLALLEQDRTQFIYGTTSGGGPQAKIPIPPAEQRKRAREWGRRRSGGGGFGGGYVDDRAVRGMIFCRLANYIEGNAKSRAVVAEGIASMLDKPLPKVPLDGQVGAGEILPLAHVLSKLPPMELEEGEPMALVNGSPCSAALAGDVALQARNRLENAHRVFALSIEGFQAPLAAYDPDLAANWGSPWEGEALRLINQNLKGGKRAGRRFYQAPVNYRVLPRILGQAHRAVELMEKAAATSIASVTDNPVYILPTKEHPYGRAFSTGGYHNGMAYPAMDMLSHSWADLASIADRQTTKFHNAEVSLLPHMLMKPDTEGWGTGGLGFIQVGFGEKARWAAQRTFLPPSEGGGFAQNDVASPTFLAYQKESIAATCLDSAMAILAVVASQAFWAVERKTPKGPLGETLEYVRSYVAPVDGRGSRKLGDEIEKLANAFGAYALTTEYPEAGANGSRDGRARATARRAKAGAR